MIKHLTQEQVNLVPTADWYHYTLECGHSVFTRVRIAVPHSYNEHFIRCPKCQSQHPSKFNWQPITGMTASSKEETDKIMDGYAFVLGDRILRTDGTSKDGSVLPSGNPLPYKPGVHE